MPETSTTLTERLVSLARSKWLLPSLLLVEIAETTFIPWPYEIAFVALCLAARERIWLFVLITVLGSAIAGAIMYMLGAYFAEPISSWLGVEAIITEYGERFAQEGAAFILLGGATPLPSYLINMTAGASQYPFWSFIVLFSFSRFVRFALLGGLIYFFGDRFIGLWERLPKVARRILSVAFVVGIIYLIIASFADI